MEKESCMNILILDGLRSHDQKFQDFLNKIIKNLKENNINSEHICLRSISLKDCLGCFGCWVKTPGSCIIDDDLNSICKKFMQSDIVFVISPVIFGGYSYEFKKFLDRSIPTILPYFRKIFGETHHKLRYDSYPKHVYIGFQTNDDKKEQAIFRFLVERNRLNLHDTKQMLVFFNEKTDDKRIDEWCSNIIAELKGGNNHGI
jgi:multimeric flavodoxin WrbA